MSFNDYFSSFVSQIPFIGSFLDSAFIENFHFIRPWWLLAFFALWLTLTILKRIRYYQSPWKHFLPPHLSTVLLEKNDNTTPSTSSKTHSPTLIKPFFIGVCLIIALAGPAWNKLPQPVYQLDRGSVLIMDMSYSMYSTDIMPNRLTRARYKAVDLLENINEGDIGLIAYAGDAFVISPLTEDIRNIELLLPSLSPDIMPVLGADALVALTLANETLNNAGHLNGDIYWFTDDVDNEEISEIYAWSAKHGHKLHILGIGTQAGAPIKLTTGELLKDNSGAIVVPKLPSGKLAALAQRGGGNYSIITNDDSDIKQLTKHLITEFLDNANAGTSKKEQQENRQGDQYQEQGPWLLLLVIPFFLSYFRRGSTILSIGLFLPLSWFIGLSALTLPSKVYAAEPLQKVQQQTRALEAAPQLTVKPEKSSFWKDLWQTKDQQAQQNFEQKKYKEAATQFNNKQWQGSAHYKAGNYQEALDAFKQSDSSSALYNQGNSHAQMQQYDKALDAYKKALAKDPNLTDAQDNIDKIEALKKQEEEQNKSQDGEKSEESGDESQEKNQEQQSQDQSKDSDSEQQEGQQSDEKNGQQQDESQSQEEKEQQEKEQSDEESEAEKEKQKQQAAQQGEEEEGEAGEKTAAQIASDKKAQEDMQKHQQLLNKVTDDPYLLLRNKMRLEYQKRQHESNRQGENKKW